VILHQQVNIRLPIRVSGQITFALGSRTPSRSYPDIISEYYFGVCWLCSQVETIPLHIVDHRNNLIVH